ncbi:MAG: plasmid pRiA4b ORF-3 family protein [Chloroflexota bacterium]|nr:plasmid pRiA4b ORF-3 family protein [Chloroflexota bacterium]
MAPRKKAAPNAVYQLKVTLKRTRPPIWRRLHVRSDTRLSALHEIIQTAMGWWNCHLHQFTIGGEEYGAPDLDEWFAVRDEQRVSLHQLPLPAKARFSYQYDFGDDWAHEIVVEKILPPDPIVTYPICLTGKRACPPEDVGGTWGYTEFLDNMSDPHHGEHESMREWNGRKFDSEAFNLDTVNARLQSFR